MPRKRYHRPPEPELRRILADTSRTYHLIGLELGVPAYTIQKWAGDLNCRRAPKRPKRQYPAELIDTIVRLHTAGDGYRKIGKALDINYRTIGRILDRAGIPPRRPGRRPKPKEIRL